MNESEYSLGMDIKYTVVLDEDEDAVLDMFRQHLQEKLGLRRISSTEAFRQALKIAAKKERVGE